MLAIKRVVRGFYRLLLPTTVFLILAFAVSSVWLVYQSTLPPKSPYLMTPEKYGLLSTRAAKVTEETWTNKDGTPARGWLLRGTEGSPVVVLLHRYGADRSWVLNLGVKLNEATDFTVLMPDLRGHGENSAVKWTSLGGIETDDVFASLEFVKNLKAESGNPLVSSEIGLYGVELGALVAISAAAKDPNVKALAIDSVPAGSDDLLASVISRRYPFASFLTAKIAQSGVSVYFFNTYKQDQMCDLAKTITNRKVLLLASSETEKLQASTTDVAACFPNQAMVEKKLDLMPSGYNIINASNEQSGTYDLRVIDYFKKVFTPTVAE